MAATRGLTATVLLRIGEGRASEVGSFEIPLHAVVNRDMDGPFAGAYIEVDLVAMHEGFRAALHELADAVPPPPAPEPPTEAERLAFMGAAATAVGRA